MGIQWTPIKNFNHSPDIIVNVKNQISNGIEIMYFGIRQIAIYALQQ
jgi:hypothetical protein